MSARPHSTRRGRGHNPEALPPTDERAEQNVLAHLHDFGRESALLAEVHPEHFVCGAHPLIFAAFTDLLASGQACGSLDVAVELERRGCRPDAEPAAARALPSSCGTVPLCVARTELAKLAEATQKRELLTVSANLREASLNGSGVADILAGMREDLARIEGPTESAVDDGPTAPAASMSFPLHCLPPTAKAMAEAVCVAVRVPASLAGPVALGILSGSIGGGLELESGSGRHSCANLYVLPSGESGSGKSECLRWFAAPFLAAERASVEAHARDTLPGALADVRMIEVEMGVENDRLKKAARAGGLAPAEREEIRARLQEKEAALALARARLQVPVYRVENITTEELAALLSRRGETLFSLSGDARGLIDNVLGRYTKGDRTDESLLLKGWSRDSEQVNRVGRPPVTLHRPCLAALWLVQPDKLDELLSNASLTDGGLLPRFLLCHSGCVPEKMPDGPVPSVPEETAEAWASTVGDLLECWRNREGEAAVVRPTAAAHELFRSHYNASVDQWEAGQLRDVNGFRARWTEQGWRIALCLHAGLWGPEAAAHPLTEDTAGAALIIADWFTAQQLTILTRGRGDRRHARLESLCAKLAGYGGSATLRDLRDNNGFAPEEVKALAVAFSGRLDVAVRTAGRKGGRPSETAFLVNSSK